MNKPAKPGMHDPADTGIHARKGAAPYPKSAKNTVERATPADDLEDPAKTDPEAPHDRGAPTMDGQDGARDSMARKARSNRKAWEKGKTQNKP